MIKNRSLVRSILLALAVVGLTSAVGVPNAAADWRDRRDWRHHEWRHSEWRRHHPYYYVAPGYVYAPPPVVYAPPPVYPWFSFNFRID